MRARVIWCRQMQSSAVNTLVCLRRRGPSLALLARDADPDRIGALVCLRQRRLHFLPRDEGRGEVPRSRWSLGTPILIGSAIALVRVYSYAFAADQEFDGG